MDNLQKQKSKRIVLPDGFNYQKYEADGVDIGLLMSSLNRSPTERAECNKSMISLVEEARKSREKYSNATSRS